MRDNNNEYGELDFLAGLKTDTIAESTAGAGVTIDGCLIKDGATCDGGGGGLSGDAYWGKNLVKNSPGQIPVDGAEPQWWDDVANATITDEDTAGEGIADIHERVFKVVTTANDVYGYQTLTFADEEVLDAGQTVVSFGCWVYCTSGQKASIAIYGTNLGLQESAQAGAGAWTWLEIENITLNAADANIEIRLIVDTDTAWFTMPMLAIGPEAQPWKPRGWKWRNIARVQQLNLAGVGDAAWSDTDCTANTDPLATMIQCWAWLKEPNGIAGSLAHLAHDDALTGADAAIQSIYIPVVNIASTMTDEIQCNDSQVIRYYIDEIDGDADLTFLVYLGGFYMWG